MCIEVLISNLKEILENKGISIRQFSKDIDYRFESVRKLCNNELERLPVELLERVCLELDIDISELLKLVTK